MNKESMIIPQKIWGLSRTDNDDEQRIARLELTDLLRFKGFWYCSFHEGAIHSNHPAGRCRLIRSQDGKQWETAGLLAWDGADVREINLSITPEGWLMGITSLYFVSREPRSASKASSKGESYTPTEVKNPKDIPAAYYQLEASGTPSTDAESQVARQSVTWLSQDGMDWGSAYAPANGINTWRWDVTWNGGMGYSVSYVGPNNGTLFRTRDGKEWRVLAKGIFPPGQANETTIAFDNDGTAYALARDAISRRISGEPCKGVACPMLGVGIAPYYTEWEWKELTMDLGEDGGLLPVEEALLCPLGGPKLIRLSDGRLLAAARVMFPGDNDGHIALFFLDPATATLRKFADIDGTTYPGIVEHEGQVWVSCGQTDASSICLAKVDLPSDIT